MGHETSTEVAAATSDEDLRAVVARLSGRVTALEEALAATGAARAGATRDDVDPTPEEIPEAILPVLIAAAAAYLGVHPVLRQVRLVDSSAWAQAGRARLQASHALPQTTRIGA